MPEYIDIDGIKHSDEDWLRSFLDWLHDAESDVITTLVIEHHYEVAIP